MNSVIIRGYFVNKQEIWNIENKDVKNKGTKFNIEM